MMQHYLMVSAQASAKRSTEKKCVLSYVYFAWALKLVNNYADDC